MPTPESAIAEQLQSLSLEIYARLACQFIAAGKTDNLEQLAQQAQAAAKAYFRSLGIEFDA